MSCSLSIAIVTMNRADQLQKAIESCLRCSLPSDTEFVIVDNASVDDTEKRVKELFANYSYILKYEKSSQNIGAGKGRNVAFSHCSGKYVFGMDDDAYIDESNSNFFLDAIDTLDRYPSIAALATQIYDKAWGKNRQIFKGNEVFPGLYETKMFCGGSHFLRREFFDNPPYFSNLYGYEELPPSLIAYDEGNIVAFCPALIAIHDPAINKWGDSNMQKKEEALIIEFAVQYSVKKMMYPTLFEPICKMAYRARIKKYLSKAENAQEKCDALANETETKYFISRKIKPITVIHLFKKFGLSVF